MIRNVLWLLLLIPVVFSGAALVAVDRADAICNTPPPVPPDPPNPKDGTPTTGIPRATPTPRRPATPAGRRSGVPTGGFLGFRGSWRIWWDFNREFILGIKGVTKIETSGGDSDSAVDPMGRARKQVREALTKVSLSGGNEDVRAAALRALGRAGNPADAEVFLRVLRAPNQPRQVVQSAAIGLAILPQIRSEEVRKAIRELFDALLADRVKMPERARLVGIMALSARGRTDPALVRAVAKRLERGDVGSSEASAMLFGAGLTRTDLMSPMLALVTESGELDSDNLQDVARAHGALALSLAGGSDSAATLAKVLTAKGTQVHTRRSICIALGHLLRDGTAAGAAREAVRRALVTSLEGDPDPLVKGYSAIALGMAKPAFPPAPLLRALATGANTLRPYAALAIGIASRNLPAAEAVKLQEHLLKTYQRSKGKELPGALAIALGLAGSEKARPLITAHVASPRIDDATRGPACQALGLLGGTDENSRKALLKALADPSDSVAQNAALGLGIRGGADIAMLLVRKLAGARSEVMQAHMVTGLSHVGGVEIVQPLLILMLDPARKRDTRISATTALGLIVAPREDDLLFEIDAHSNPYGLTEAGRELVRVF